MGLKIERKLLERIVEEEFQLFIKEQLVLERGKTTQVAGDELPPEEDVPVDDETVPDPSGAPEEALPTHSPVPDVGDAAPPGAPPAVSGEEPPGEAPPELPGDESAPGEEDFEPEEGSIAQEIQGKSIEEVSFEEQSKLIPGAQEFVVKFSDGPDALHVILTKTGTVKYFYKGLRSSLTSADDEIDVSDDDLDDVEPMGDEDMPPEEAPEEEEAPKED